MKERGRKEDLDRKRKEQISKKNRKQEELIRWEKEGRKNDRKGLIGKEEEINGWRNYLQRHDGRKEETFLDTRRKEQICFNGRKMEKINCLKGRKKNGRK